MKFEGQNYRVELLATESGIAIVGGHFGQARIAYGELFKLRMKQVETGEERILTSLDDWKAIDVCEENGTTKFVTNSWLASGWFYLSDMKLATIQNNA